MPIYPDNKGAGSGASGVTTGSTSSTGTSNTLLKTNNTAQVADASAVTNPVAGQLQFQPAKTDYAIVIDRSDNTGDTSGIKLVSGDGSNTAANHAFTILNSAKDRAVTQTFDSTTSFAFLVDSSSLRFATSGGVGGREIRFQGTGSGNAAVDRFVTPPSKALTNNTATSIFDIALPTLTGTGGVIKGTTFVSNGTDIQSRSFVWRYTAVNKGGVYTTEIAVVSEAASVSTGTLTGTWTIVTGTNKITLKFNSNSSLTPTTQWVQCTLETFSDQAVTVL